MCFFGILLKVSLDINEMSAPESTKAYVFRLPKCNQHMGVSGFTVTRAILGPFVSDETVSAGQPFRRTLAVGPLLPGVLLSFPIYRNGLRDQSVRRMNKLGGRLGSIGGCFGVVVAGKRTCVVVVVGYTVVLVAVVVVVCTGRVCCIVVGLCSAGRVGDIVVWLAVVVGSGLESVVLVLISSVSHSPSFSVPGPRHLSSPYPPPSVLFHLVGISERFCLIVVRQ